MRQRWRRNALAGVLIGVGAGCGQLDSEAGSQSLINPGDYTLGGQTGSLIPDCGVAPLSASGYAVPMGDALAVLYGAGCPEALAAERVALSGPEAEPIAVTLEALRDGVYLVRASETLAGGRYALDVEGRAQDGLAVTESPANLPVELGALASLPSSESCSAGITFELALSAEAAAHLPLMRWFVRIDGGDRQLWADFGALELASEAGDPVGQLYLPRCTPSGCLAGGDHELELDAEVAGEGAEPEPTSITFTIDCPEPPAPEDDGCALNRPPTSSSSSGRWLLGAATALALVARQRRQRPRSPGP